MFSADAEIGRDLAGVDWEGTPLGPPQHWPQSLRTAVSILLSSRFSMWMAWGPELTFFCNAAYRRHTLGQKYPWALGRPASEVWAEVWKDVSSRVENVLSTGEATWDEALLLFLERSGYPEETYHTFSYSPLRDDAGAVVGMLCVVSEETERVIGERRMAILRDLGSEPGVLRTEPEQLAFAGRQLQRNPEDLPFTLTYLFEGDDDHGDGHGDHGGHGHARLAAATGVPAGHPVAPATLALADAGALWPAATSARGEEALVALDGPPFTRLPSGVWAAPPTQALVVPLLRQGGAPYGFLVAALNRYRPLDDGYRGFVELVAGHIAGGIGAARGYHAQQRRTEELAELDRAKTAFYTNVSHEFRTPLTLIMGPVQELLSAESDPRVRQELEVVRRNGARLGKLVNSLLDFSRIEAGRMQAHYEPVDLAATTAELASVFRSATEKAGLAFEVDCPPLPQPVYVDRAMWERVVLNLLSNALKFTFDGTIRVAAGSRGGQAEVTVSDTGIGVPEHEMPRLFERFHRIESARSRSHEGSGIGLALVKELVGLHGGTIAAESREGEGTAFTVRLPFGSAHLPADAVVHHSREATPPLAAEPYAEEALRWLADPVREDAEGVVAPPAPALPAPAPPAPALPAPVPPVSAPVVVAPPPRSDRSDQPAPAGNLLVADDNADMRGYLTRLLRAAGYAVRQVPDGQTALDAARAERPDLVVSDVMMPRLDGLRLVEALRADPRTEGIPVVLLSARAGPEASIEGLEAGADDYLVKPFSAAELLARVRANVRLARLRTAHARWRTALVDSLQEAFFVCDEDGAVVEINNAFTDLLGYGPEGLPYRDRPWWPDVETDPEAHRATAQAAAFARSQERGACTAPATHRDGRRLWLTATFSQVGDPDSGRSVTVGTLRDVTAEHYTAQRETAVAAMSLRLSRADSLGEALDGALEELRAVWHADRVVAAVFGAAGPTVIATDPDAAWERLSDEQRSAVTALRDGPPLTPSDGSGGAGVRLEHPHGPMVLWLDLAGRRPFTDQDHLLLSLLAGHLVQGLARAHQIDEQRETALALQRAILGPSRLPGGFAVRYEPAARPLEVGGDWYDTIPLPDGRIGIVVGDCVGRGLSAATVMGQLRSACRALLLQDPRPEQALAALDHFAAGVPGALCTTVFCGVLDPGTGQLVYSSAGHPPGILVHPDGTVRLLEEGRATPLAVRVGAVRPSAEHTVPGRATLLLYTDGLVERRRRRLTDGIVQAGEAVRDGWDADLEGVADQVMARLAPAEGYDDDVALLLYRHPTSLDLAFPAEAGQLARVRGALRDWLSRCDLPPRLVQSVLVAAGEACANAIEHGHRDLPGQTVRLHAEAVSDRVRVTVADTGRWKPPGSHANADRGRGLTLMRAMMQDVTIAPGPTGTTVEMHARIAR
ncbi:SpoIIE family protein phosphatase [Streptacidiphilus neutrinimicus]|uniref:SpoIIE family protein phosphatase n=1 Tax=Streptacidiphilus neutrinimicus TaxID=105420 RepID=UPI0005A7B7BF|nr:SpoIIE family protein phosphatase [Streptacidiphilus neutrinimicus]